LTGPTLSKNINSSSLTTGSNNSRSIFSNSKIILTNVVSQKYSKILHAPNRLVLPINRPECKSIDKTISEEICVAENVDNKSTLSQNPIDHKFLSNRKNIEHQNDVRYLIFFIHGVGGCMKVWEDQIRYFNSKGET